ncbi:BREX-1 system adenine-specific DNA-methyltransferase PglX [Tetragenococcus halophilus]|uniref:BREX-1 system adenine-specific DNA-methyltransferase PglX n=1 Tax=Tetragenococcus halophilus TaxID=51669 RepID=UPI001F325D2A|nr:BREX-1 system adenine-specific DNA-methyltransferase PglX [Tetragenococcus halophilus]MCF1602540.1 BREX-1 system adenine-specific DNA-methyltransferase PglX [Tetragenococcus halophilus]WJS82745.1 BREX-1 system adenine-specific DNA-methyltransferase PglX [Tetragenococcus halophilus]
MDRKAIKSFAVNARRKLINEVTRKASLLGINNEHIKNVSQIDKNLQEVAGTRIQGKEITQRKQLVNELYRRETNSTYQEAFQSLIDEVAYTWFNRLIAIRFMEVNDYLPDVYRVLSSESVAKKEPDIITDIYETDLYEEMTVNEKEQVRQWKNDGSSEAMDQLYQLVFIKICNQLNDYLPELFEPIEDYTELLFTASYIKEDGVVRELLTISEEDFDISQGGQIEIIGWLYQYYNSEPHNEVVNIYKSTVKKKDIPAATQLFTTDWVVRYMVDNSLGKYWLDHYPDSEVRSELTYLISDKFNDKKTSIKSDLQPKELKIMDNAMGSGHILVYAFDVLITIYSSVGYSQRDAARLIIENNLYGLEIDKRAYQIAYFAIMMKGRQYDRSFLRKKVQPNIRKFIDLPEITDEYRDRIITLNNGQNDKFEEYKRNVFEHFINAKELGSIIKLTNQNNNQITKEYLQEIREYLSIFNDYNTMDELYGLKNVQESLLEILDIAEMMIDKYTAVVTNPPYLNKMDKFLKAYVMDRYRDVKKDLFSVFIQMNSQMLVKDGYASFMSPYVWMFISSYEKLRSFLIEERTISSLIQMEYSAFEEATVPICTFTIKNSQDYIGNYIRLSDFTGGMEVQRLKTLEAINNFENCDYHYNVDQSNFKKIPGMTIAYWANDNITNVFTSQIKNNYHVLAGISTGNNEKYLKYWHEINFSKFRIDFFPISKGGNFRRWYGNNEFVVNYTKKTIEEMEKLPGFRHDGKNFYFKEMLSWSKITSGKISVRKYHGAIFDSSAPAIFPASNYLLGFLNSKVASQIMGLVNPTLNSPPGYVSVLPDPYFSKEAVEELVEACVNLSISDWNAFESSWNFSTHPFLLFKKKGTLKEAFNSWTKVAERRFQKLKNTEEKLNLVFIKLYNLTEDITPEIEDREVTVNKGSLLREIISFISYAVGCMFGRYSLDEEGLIYAGGTWNADRYHKFKPNTDNVLLITDNEYFRDSSMDIVNRFIDFVETTFGRDTLEENLQFIADTLGGKGTSREILRRYFVKDFYKDHLKTYQKRPIYWQLDSGKQDGFKALIYLHRYTPDQLGKVRTDYLHELQKAYNNRIELRTQQIQASENQKEINSMQKEIAKVQKQLKEIREYDEKLSHLALQRIELDLDDGVVVNYDKLQRAPDDGKKYSILAKGVKEPKK